MIYLKSFIALLSLGIAPLLAACPSIKCIKQQVVRQQVEQVYAAVAVAAPVYGAGYQQQTDNRELIDVLRRILERLDSIERNQRSGGGGQEAPLAIDGKALVEQTCIKCHQPAMSVKAGTDFILVEEDGKLSPLSLEQKRRIENRVVKAHNMPPGKPLEPAQGKAVVDFLNANRTEPK